MLAALALVARHDPRPRVADAAAAAVVGCAEAHYGGWSAAVWDSVLRRALSYIVDLPYPPSADEDGSTPAARRVVSNTYNRLFLLALSTECYWVCAYTRKTRPSARFSACSWKLFADACTQALFMNATPRLWAGTSDNVQ